MQKNTNVAKLSAFIEANFPDFHSSNQICEESDLFIKLENEGGEVFKEWIEIFSNTVLKAIESKSISLEIDLPMNDGNLDVRVSLNTGNSSKPNEVSFCNEADRNFNPANPWTSGSIVIVDEERKKESLKENIQLVSTNFWVGMNDVYGKYDCSEEEAISVLNAVFNDEYLMGEINEAIDISADIFNLKKRNKDGL
jgi:hypothetical protein